MIIATKTKDGYYYVGQDTRLVHAEWIDDNNLESNDLIFTAKDDPNTIIAVSGQFRVANVIRYMEGYLPDPNKTITMSDMVTKIVPAMSKELARYHYVDPDEDGFELSKTEVMILRKHKAYLVLLDGSVQELGDAEAIGKCAMMADGCLFMNEDLNARERIIDTFKRVTTRTAYLGRNLLIYNTLNPDKPERVAIDQ